MARLHRDPFALDLPWRRLRVGSCVTGARPNLTTFRKLVVGDRDYRVVYRVDPDGSVVVVWVIGRCSDDEVYHLAVSRLKLHPAEVAREFAVALDEIWSK